MTNGRNLTLLQRRVLDGRSPKDFERIYGPKATDKLFGSRHTCTPTKPIQFTAKIAVTR